LHGLVSCRPGRRLAGRVERYYLDYVPGPIDRLACALVLGALLEKLIHRFGGYELVAHWTQGEFHHDVVLELPDAATRELPGRILVVATNCNGGIKEVLCFGEVPDRRALWHHRCPNSDEFRGELGPVLGHATTEHWFDPCELLAADARSELRPEHRRRQEGGGWEFAGPPRGGSCGRAKS
jgi:hypothetical protein